MNRLAMLDVDAPPNFPTKGWNRLARRMPIEEHVFQDSEWVFIDAWQGAATRFLAVESHGKTLHALASTGWSPSRDVALDQALFDMVANASAAMDNLAFAAWICIAGTMAPNNPKLVLQTSPRDVSFPWLAKRAPTFSNSHPKFASAVTNVIQSPEWTWADKVRNVLSHRRTASQGFAFNESGMTEMLVLGEIHVTIDTNLREMVRRPLVKWLALAVDALVEDLDSHLPPFDEGKIMSMGKVRPRQL